MKKDSTVDVITSKLETIGAGLLLIVTGTCLWLSVASIS